MTPCHDGKKGVEGPSNAYHHRGIAASLALQAAFTTKTYKPQTSSLFVPQHVFISDTPLTNWAGSSLYLTQIVRKHSSRESCQCANGKRGASRNVSRRGASADRAIRLKGRNLKTLVPSPRELYRKTNEQRPVRLPMTSWRFC